jgi:hypothetical protein
MSTRVTERVEEWDSRPFSGGYGALHDLASEGFSGVVRAGGAELYLTKGAAVGLRNGTVEDFEAATGTVYEAPTPALPLLAVMQEHGGDARAQYYSEDTSIAEVDGKLESGGFTGYIELSENVLSGDYYVVYHRGQSMSVAFVGNTGQLLEGEEAFERADGEVGIYRVHPATIDPVDVPEPTGRPDGADEDDGGGTTAGAVAGPAAGGSEADGPAEGEESGNGSTTGTASAGGPSAATAEDRATEQAAGAEDTPEASDPAGDDPAGDRPPGETDTGPEQRAASDALADRAEPDTAGGETTEGDAADQDTAEHHADQDTAGRTAGPEGVTREGRTDDSGGRDPTDVPIPDPGSAGEQPDSEQAGTSTPQSGPTPQDGAATAAGGTDSEEPSRPGRSKDTESPGAGPEGDRPLETHTIPSLDPRRSESRDRGPAVPESDPSGDRDAGTAAASASEGDTQEDAGTAGESTRQGGRSPEPAADQSETGGVPTGETPTGEPPTDRGDADPARVAELEAELDDRTAEIESLESRLETATADRDRLEAKLEGLREERDELAAEVERLESELERLETEFGAAADERRISSQEALDGTDVFVRYHSKGDATLEKAHSSNTRRADVVENLRLEKHTQFDADAVSVGGQSYTEFVEGTVVYQFVDWVATELLFEIRDTGHTDALKTLYDALPSIDRAELNGTVDVVYAEDGQESRSTETFDVVLRDRMGTPLVVANLNDSREAATESMMESLITSAERVGRTSDDFAGAFFVTESFFEPGALETASEVTRGGLLSRNKRKSFVNLSRKRGYHLCLVEARNQNFNLTVPEL